MEKITLYYKQGSSDKVYHVSIDAMGQGYAVNFAYGRRGSSLQTGTKNAVAVNYGAAKAIYDKLVKEKMAKGYTPGEDGTPYQQTGKEQEVSGINCQLLNPVDEGDVDRLIRDPAYWMQEKFDGRRLMIRKEGDLITGINRLGLTVALPKTLVDCAVNCPVNFIIDGEAIGDDIHVFDALKIDNEELRGVRYGERYLKLMNLLASFQHPHIHLVNTSFLPQHKREDFAKFKADGKEGVVFKFTDALYVAGRPASGGYQRKFKFYENASLIVTRINAKRSVSLMLFNGDKITPAGNVTIPTNHDIPEIGHVIECRYLYAFRESGSIYQPVYLGRREDIRADECTVDQLKYKAELVEVAA